MLELLECRQLIEVCLCQNGSMETSKRFHARNDEGQGDDQSRERIQL